MLSPFRTLLLIAHLILAAKGQFTFSNKVDHAVLVAYNGTNTIVTVPASNDGLPVREIARYAFWGKPIKTVTLPSGLQRIGVQAFHQCTMLTEVNLPEGLLALDSGAFSWCRSLPRTRSLPVSKL
jgi:hypothetical protein